MSKITEVIKRSGAKVPFTPERITNAIYRAAIAVGGRDRAQAEDLSTQVVALLEANTPVGTTPNIEQIQDLVEKVLIENGHARVAKAYILYRNERARQRDRRKDGELTPSGNIPWSKIWSVLDWSVDHGVNTITLLNEKIQSGAINDVVTSAEAAYNEDVENAANLVLERKG